MKRTTTLTDKDKNDLFKFDKDNLQEMKMLTNELNLEEISLLRQRYNEKMELSQTATLVKDYVNVLKDEMKDKLKDMNNDNLSNKNLIPFLPNQNYLKFKTKKSTGNNRLKIDNNYLYLEKNNIFGPTQFSDLGELNSPFSKLNKKENYKFKKYESFHNLGIKNKIIDIDYDKKSRRSKKSKNSNQSENDDKSISKMNYNLSKTYKKVQSHISESSYNNKKTMKSSKMKSQYKIKIENYDDGYDSDKKNELLYKKTGITNDGVLKLNDLKKEIKNSFIGENIIKFKDNKKFVIEDSIHPIESSLVKNEIIEDEENDDIVFKEQRYRNLQKKGYVYDSLDDEEIIEDQMNLFYINPESIYIILFDFLVFICSFFNIIFIPYFLGNNEIYCRKSFITWDNFIELFIDVIYICDIIISFFVAIYNFDEILNTDLKIIAYNYLDNWFIWDIIASIPFKTILSISDTRCRQKAFMITPLYHNNYYYLLISLRIVKLYKVIYNNKFLDVMSNYLNEINHFSDYLKIYSNIIAFLISIHIVSNLYIFIARNDYPNWIIHYGYEAESYIKLYLISIYYTIETLTTVGYGDITCVTPKEKIFGLFMECVGIFAYSWIVTSVSNYVKILHERYEEFENKIKILDRIKLSVSHFPDELYDKISRYLKYKQDSEKLDKKIIFESLPVGLSNILIYEMYKPIINNFVFFKNFDNIDFIVKVVLNFNPILSVRNDILIKEGDYVEDIIFIKRGRLNLELPLDFLNNEVAKNLTNTTLLLKNEYSNKPKKKKRRFRRFLAKFKRRRKKSKTDLIDDDSQNYKILELRRNEHFGDILMFLNQRSPLNVRVKTKKAELYFLNKKDALDISTNFPIIWKQISKKSLFNYEQIKRLMNKVKKIFMNSHGTKNKEKNSKIKAFKNSSEISEQMEFNESELKSIPTMTNINDSSLLENLASQEKDDVKKTTKKSKFQGLNTINESSSNSSSSDSTLKSNKGRKKIKNKRISINQHISEKSEDEESYIPNEEKDHNLQIIDSINDNFSKKNYSNENIIQNENHITPFLPEDINDEIYPNETFFNGNLNVEDKKFTRNKTKELKLRINKEYMTYKKFNHYKTSSFLFDKNNNNDNNTNLNCSICSTEISFTLNSEYENINELSDYKYSKDSKLRKKISDILKGKEDKSSDKTSRSESSSSSDSEEKKENNKEKNKDEFSKLMINKRQQRRQSISFFQMANKFGNLSLTKDDIEESGKSKKSITKILNKKKTSDNGISKGRKSLLVTLNENIERNQINLNNPELFYLDFFKDILDKKKEKDGEKPVTKEKDELSNKLGKGYSYSKEEG